jgi:hypothetical protein
MFALQRFARARVVDLLPGVDDLKIKNSAVCAGPSRSPALCQRLARLPADSAAPAS